MSVREEYKFIIEEEYQLTEEDISEIAKFYNLGKNWDDGSHVYKNFKDNIKYHLKSQQRGRCAFCRCEIDEGTADITLEHLIGKTDYPQFETLPKNLVDCCLPCNRNKNNKAIIKNPNPIKSQQNFPTNSDDFLIINPYCDKYENNIDFIDEVLIKGISDKGIATIEKYKLFRPQLAETRAKEWKIGTMNLQSSMMQRLTEKTISQDLLDQAQNIVNEIPRWIYKEY